MSGDPFEPIGGPKKPRLKVVSETAEWEIVSPVPLDAPPPPAKHPGLGAPTATWTYRDAAGELQGFIHRFDPAGGKEFRPVALWRSTKGGGLSWRWMAWPTPRPLYGLDQLAARPSAPVVVCEGEKSAAAAGRLLPDYVCIASPNGARAAGKADWAPLAGRHVAIWPDADEPGDKYAAEARECITAAGAASVGVVALPDGLAEGWDLANAEEEGWTAAKIEPLVRAASSAAADAKGRRPTSKEGVEKPKKSAKKRGVSAIINLVVSAEVQFWHDDGKNAYATFNVQGHRENHRLDSREFSRWIAGSAYSQGLTPPSSGSLGDALRVFEAKAVNEGPLRVPFKRVGERDGRWYIDPGYSDWSVVEVTPDGWALLSEHDLPMIRSQAMCAMPQLVKREDSGASMELLRPFVNADEVGFQLVVAWLISAFWPRGPYPILVLSGEQGTAKSSLTQLLRNIVDPNTAPLRAMPRDENDLMISATHSRVMALNNVSRVSGEASDILCSIATGGGTSARAKFTDGDEFIVNTKNPIIMNGIPTLTSRPDLASRALVVQLKPIPEEDRKTEEELKAEWEPVAPCVLAALLDVMTCALGNLPSTRLSRSARMADFERLVEAAAPALGWEPGEFGQAYRGNQDELDAIAIEADDVASVLLALIRDDHPRGWAGTVSQLFALLNAQVSELTKRSKSWPQNPIGLGNRITRITPALRRHGLIIERKHSGDRKIHIVPTAKAAAPAAPPPDEDVPF